MGNAKVTPHFVRANPILAIHKQPEGRKPLFKGNGRIREDGSDLERKLCAGVLAVALPAARSLHIDYVVGVAERAADNAIRPSRLNHELAAILVIGKEFHRFQQRFRVIMSLSHG